MTRSLAIAMLVATAAAGTLAQVSRTTRKPPSRKEVKLPALARPAARPRPAPRAFGDRPEPAPAASDKPYFEDSGTGKPQPFGPSHPSMEPGLLAEDRIGAGTTKALTLTLAAGEYVHVEVDQNEVDVALSLVGPDGARLVDIDAAANAADPESLHFAAMAGGVYSLEVRAADPDAVEGGVRIHLKQIRVPEGRDLSRVSAQSAFTAGSALLRDGATRARGIFKLVDALKLFTTLGDGPYVLHTLDRLGLFAEPRAALGYLDQALAIRRAAGDTAGEASTHERLAELHAETGDNARAIESLVAAGALYASLGDGLAQARVLDETGDRRIALGEAAAALELHGRALELRRATGDRPGAGGTLRRIGAAHLRLGDAARAVESLEPAVAAARDAGDVAGEATALQLLGEGRALLGDHARAVEAFTRALAGWTSVADVPGEAAALKSLGASQAALGDAAPALASLGKARGLFRDVRDPKGEADAGRLLAGVHARRAEWPAAIAALDAAVTPIRALSDRRAEAAVLHDIGTYYGVMGDANGALRYFNQALPLRRGAADRAGEATTLIAMGESLLQLDNRLVAVDVYFKPALAILRELNDTERAAALERRLAALGQR
jgi:tetratricopeptide (TPR) repeat protein